MDAARRALAPPPPAGASGAPSRGGDGRPWGTGGERDRERERGAAPGDPHSDGLLRVSGQGPAAQLLQHRVVRGVEGGAASRRRARPSGRSCSRIRGCPRSSGRLAADPVVLAAARIGLLDDLVAVVRRPRAGEAEPRTGPGTFTLRRSGAGEGSRPRGARAPRRSGRLPSKTCGGDDASDTAIACTPRSAPSIAAATVPEYVTSLPRFGPWFTPEMTMSSRAPRSTRFIPMYTASVGVPSTAYQRGRSSTSRSGRWREIECDDAGLLAVRRHDPDLVAVEGGRERREPRRVDAVVVREEDSHARESTNRTGAPPGEQPSRALGTRPVTPCARARSRAPRPPLARAAPPRAARVSARRTAASTVPLRSASTPRPFAVRYRSARRASSASGTPLDEPVLPEALQDARERARVEVKDLRELARRHAGIPPHDPDHEPLRRRDPEPRLHPLDADCSA